MREREGQKSRTLVMTGKGGGGETELPRYYGTETGDAWVGG